MTTWNTLHPWRCDILAPTFRRHWHVSKIYWGPLLSLLKNARSFGDIQRGALLSRVAIVKGCLRVKLLPKRIAVCTCFSLFRTDASWEWPGLDSLAPHLLCRDSISVKEACAPLSWTVQLNKVSLPLPPLWRGEKGSREENFDTLGIFFNLSSWTLFLFC